MIFFSDQILERVLKDSTEALGADSAAVLLSRTARG